ncbi:YqaJ viral recombinase family protein [Frigoribacterium sp. 2-23]|uniref:YqaJ viral recombinase family protein n=1 Tax=Frigoribacterium sp. 2-23 TaxID=3415006 RepID=UPI003C703719
MTVVQPMLSLWDDDEPEFAPRPVQTVQVVPAHVRRILADSSDRIGWLRARSQGITATDVARLSSRKAIQAVVLDKLYGNGFGGNAYTDHGRAREPEIARWVLREHGIEPSSKLFHAPDQRLHLATPDGVVLRDDGRVELCEIKTTKKEWASIPRSYLRQVFWQQYVLGAERTLVVWERHVDFVPVAAEPLCRWVERDDDEIQRLVTLADEVLEIVARRAADMPLPYDAYGRG